jgi:tripartite-type tricarboxylate transporter receptor subunit TctC
MAKPQPVGLPKSTTRTIWLAQQRERDMTLSRRELLSGAVSVALVARSGSQSCAQQHYPGKPVKLIVGYAAGGANDTVGRLIGQWLAERMGQSFVVENRAGAGSNIATEFVARSTPDGYTLLLVSAANAINASLYASLPYDFLRDFVPVSSICRVPNVLVVNPSFPGNTLAEFMAHAKANPGKISTASPGNGSPQHLAIELFKMMSGLDLQHVPYRGGAPALADLVSGQVQASFVTTATAIEFIKAGKLRPLAVTSEKKIDLLPEVPALGELMQGYEASAWYGLGAPKGIPQDIVDKLNIEVNAGLKDTRISSRLADLGGVVQTGSPVDFAKFIADETEKWSRVVSFSGAKVE